MKIQKEVSIDYVDVDVDFDISDVKEFLDNCTYDEEKELQEYLRDGDIDNYFDIVSASDQDKLERLIELFKHLQEEDILQLERKYNL